MDEKELMTRIHKHAKLGVKLAEKLKEIAEKLSNTQTGITPDDFSLYGKLLGRKYDEIRRYPTVNGLDDLIDEYKRDAMAYDKEMTELKQAREELDH